MTLIKILAIFSTYLKLSIQAIILLTDTTKNVQLHCVDSGNRIDIELVRNGTVQLSGRLGVNKKLIKVDCSGTTNCTFIYDLNERLSIKAIENGFNISWSVEDPNAVFKDCFNLNSSNTNWYGGPQRSYQVWPLEKMTIDGNEPYVIKKSDNFGVAEMYWLNSKGAYIWINDTTPLWVDQNKEKLDQVCFRAEAKNPYINRWRVTLLYVLMSLKDPKSAHINAVNSVLGKPRAHPNNKMIGEPIWTTWAKYKRPISDSLVLQFAKEIRSHGYTGGQLEIDDMWETCYGSQEFDKNKFSDVKNTVSNLHKDNWRVTLWIHPFVNNDCQNNSKIGQSSEPPVMIVRDNSLDHVVISHHHQTALANNAMVGSMARSAIGTKITPGGVTHAEWWNGNDAHQIDFTKPEAAKWWTDRLKKLQANHGIDSFKFDAGESDYANQPNVYEDIEHTPNILTQKYIETCVDFGDMIEVRSSFRGQQYGEFIRMLDKESDWGLQNGLATLITTLLQLNMNGYGMVLPDMIGGNGYKIQPTGDLIVRWTQANTFMPSMQFSYLPWDFKDQVTYDIDVIVKKYVDLHAHYAPNIIRSMNKSIEDGTPVNPPIWWVDPTDPVALATDDEYLLGEEILVAPVIVEKAVSRDVYLPKGQWKDGNNGTIYSGPITLKNYSAPIAVLPYFIRQ